MRRLWTWGLPPSANTRDFARTRAGSARIARERRRGGRENLEWEWGKEHVEGSFDNIHRLQDHQHVNNRISADDIVASPACRKQVHDRGGARWRRQSYRLAIREWSEFRDQYARV